MSASRWSFCPECNRRADLEFKRLEEELKEDYGKVSIEKFNERQRNLTKPDREETLREDWEFVLWEDSGEFYVTYGCCCDVCGLEYSLKTDPVNLLEVAKIPETEGGGS